MIPKTPESTNSPDQVEEKRAEIAVIESDLERYNRMFDVAEKHGDDKGAKSLADTINTQKQYLDELRYSLELLEASLDEECEDEPEDEDQDDASIPEGEGVGDQRQSEEDRNQAPIQNGERSREGRLQSHQQEG